MVNLLKHWSLQRWYVHDCHHLMGMVFISLHTLWQGADLIAGSLIKSPGGTIAPCGGYVAGKKDLVEAAAARLSAPGLGVEFGSTPGRTCVHCFKACSLLHRWLEKQ
jgi:cystathionine beta-lyase family protein involved in aluminum resistance